MLILKRLLKKYFSNKPLLNDEEKKTLKAFAKFWNKNTIVRKGTGVIYLYEKDRCWFQTTEEEPFKGLKRNKDYLLKNLIDEVEI